MTEAMPFLQKYDITFLRPPGNPNGTFKDFNFPGSSIPKNRIFWPVGSYTASMGDSVNRHICSIPNAPAAHCSWVNTDERSVFPTRLKTTACMLGCRSSVSHNSTDTKLDFPDPRPPFSTYSPPCSNIFR